MQPDHNSDIAKLSATNFDLPSLHLLLPEIDVALKDAETHLSEFNDDEDQAPLLLDSIEVLKQLGAVLDLISLDGASDLAEVISASMQKLYDEGDNTNDALILDISEAIMTLDRYVEFILLKETLVPSLLIPVLNRLNESLGRSPITEDSFTNRTHANISVANPEKNYKPLASLKLDTETLTTAYRSGLNVVLHKLNGVLDDNEMRKVKAMEAACRIASQKTDSLFWLAAESATQDIASIMPLTTDQKHTLIFLEQQFKDYLPADDKRFADLVSFAQHRNHDLAKKIKEKFAVNRLDEAQQEQLKRFLFGPDRRVTAILNDLIQDEISIVKDKVDAFVRGDSTNSIEVDADDIVQRLKTLSSVMSVLMLNEASNAFKSAAVAVSNWNSPNAEDFDELLSALMVGENASIELAKSHTPGAFTMPLHNKAISLYQLDTAYETLVHESRTTISVIEQAINDYISDPNRDITNIQNVPSMIRHVAGAARFLDIDDGANMLVRMSKYLEDNFDAGTKGISSEILGNIADIIIAVDHHLEGLEHNHPVGKRALSIGHHSLNTLLAA